MKRKINILISAVLILLILPLQFGCNKDKLLKDIEEQAVEREIPEFQGIPGELTPETDGENDQDLLDQITFVNYSTSTTKSSVTEVVDQENTSTIGQYGFAIGGGLSVRGQSFTPQLATLKAISFKTCDYWFTSGYLYIDLYEGETTSGTKIAMSNGVSIDDPGWFRVEFPEDVILKTDGTKYTAVFRPTVKFYLKANFNNNTIEGYPEGNLIYGTTIDDDHDFFFKTHALAEGDAILAYTDDWLYCSLPSEDGDSQNEVKEHIETLGGKAVNYLRNYWVKTKLLTSNLSKWAFGTAGTICTILDLFCGPAGSEHEIELAVVRENDGFTQTSETSSYEFEHGWFGESVQVEKWTEMNPEEEKIYLYQ